MKKTWLMARTTYRRRIRSTTFLLLTFGMPLLMVIAGAIPILMELRGELPRVGYVDQTGQLAVVDQVSIENEMLTLTPYADTDAAREAFTAGEIGGYLVIPAGYFDGETAIFYGEEEPNVKLEEGLKQFVRRAMLPEAPASLIERLDDPAKITYVARESGETVAQGPALLVRVVMPAALAVLIMLAIFTSASQMGAAIVREKDQRSMEMIITSLSPRELVTGKVLGMTLLSLTQVGVWTVGAGATIGLALLGVLEPSDLSIPWRALLWGALLGVPGYFLYAVIASGLGVIAGDKQQARQLSGMLGFIGMGPLYFMGALVNNLDGHLALGLTLFPLTAPTISLFRMTLAEVPTWQLFASFGILVASLAASIWFVARIFRAAMLMFGQALRPRQIWQALRQA